MCYLPGHLSSKGLTNKIAKQWGIFTLYLTDEKTGIKYISTNLTRRRRHLGYVALNVLHFEAKVSIAEATVSTISFV